MAVPVESRMLTFKSEISPRVECAHPVSAPAPSASAAARPGDGWLPAGAAGRLVGRGGHAAVRPDGERHGAVGDGRAGKVLRRLQN